MQAHPGEHGHEQARATPPSPSPPRLASAAPAWGLPATRGAGGPGDARRRMGTEMVCPVRLPRADDVGRRGQGGNPVRYRGPLLRAASQAAEGELVEFG